MSYNDILFYIEKNDLSNGFPYILDNHVSTQRSHYINAIALPQIHRISIGRYFDACASTQTGIVPGSLDDMDVDLVAFSMVIESCRRRDQRSVYAERCMYWSRALHPVAVLRHPVCGCWCDDVCPFVPFFIVVKVSG